MKRIACLILLVVAAVSGASAQQPKSPSNEFALLANLFTYDAAQPFNARTIQHVDTVGFMREKFVFDGWRGARVPGLLAVPATGPVRHGLVVLIDGIGGWKERWWQTESWNRGRLLIDSLLAAGYAVAMIDAPASGERIYENDFVSAEAFIKQLPKWRDMALQNGIEVRRLIDLLSKRADIDSTRIGLLGLSHGGMETFYLSAIDARVKAGVAGLTPMHGLPEVLLPAYYAAHIKAPLLLLAGKKDSWYTPEEVQQAFAQVAAKDKNLVWYDVGHRVPPEYAGAAVAWFRTYLR